MAWELDQSAVGHSGDLQREEVGTEPLDMAWALARLGPHPAAEALARAWAAWAEAWVGPPEGLEAATHLEALGWEASDWASSRPAQSSLGLCPMGPLATDILHWKYTSAAQDLVRPSWGLALGKALGMVQATLAG
mmetsp:Transcript_87029/g.138038  ORF Transcript_87029/g.138038 Transcript_87029/m.138038 type:complete len:135 (-) Transcript_87029:82-486(-)